MSEQQVITMKRIVTALALATIFVVSTRGQGFLNLDFESAHNLPGNPGEYGMSVSTTNALPGWSAYDGTLPLANIYYVSNYFPGASSAVELEGGSLALGGNFSAALLGDSSISQTGMVPGSAESLEFEAFVMGAVGLGGSDLLVTLGGQNLPILPEGGNVYGVDIPAGLDGQTAALIFACQGGNLLLDNIEFSVSSVPEPGEWALIGLGLMVLRFCRRKRRV